MPLPINTYIDFDADSVFTGTGEDVSERVDGDIGSTWSRGKDQIRQFAAAAAGQLAFVLTNLSEDYSPGNTGSPLYGLVVPDRKARIQTSGAAGQGFDFVDGTDFNFVDATSFDEQGLPARVIWTGRTINYAYDQTRGRNVGVSCLGNLSRLRGKTISTALFQNILTSDFLDAVLDEAGWPAGERSIQTGLTTLSFAWVDNEDAFDVVERIRATEGPGASLYEDANGFIVFENRDARETQTRSTVSQATFTASEHMTAFGHESNFDDTIEAAVIQVDERQIQGQTAIWELGASETFLANEVKRYQIRTGGDPFINAVLPSATPNDTIITLTPDTTLTSGTFKLRFREVVTASTVDWNSTAAEFQTALEGLSTIGSGNISCAGGPINTSPIHCTLTGIFAGQSITDLIEAVNAVLNPVSAPAFVEAFTIQNGNGLLTERQGIRPSAALTGGSFALDWDGDFSGTINYNDDIAAVEAAVDMQYIGNVVTGGRLDQGVGFSINLLVSTDEPEPTVVELTAITANVGTASISSAVSTQGGVADYVLTAGSISWTLNRTSGANALLTGTAGGTGCTLTGNGVRVRGQLVSVVRSHQVSFPEDITNIPLGKIYRPNIKPEITLENARQFTEMFVERSSVPRATVTVQTITSLFDPANDALYAREVSDRVHLTMPHLHIDSDWHIENLSQQVVGLALVTTYGCEEIPQPSSRPLFWY